MTLLDLQKNYPEACDLLTKACELLKNSLTQEEALSFNIDVIASDLQHKQLLDLLDDIQGNILKGHGRDFSILLFLNFTKTDPDKVKKWIAKFADQQIISALGQYKQTCKLKEYSERIARRFPDLGNLKLSPQKRFLKFSSVREFTPFEIESLPFNLFANFSLSFKGYTTLGLPAKEYFRDLFLANHSFERGMVSPKTQLGDRVKNGVKVDWEDVYRSHDIHAMILLAHDSHQQLYKQVQEITQEIKSNGIKIVQMELGCTRKNHKNQPVEPFGFPDGISQPLFFTEDINKEKGKNWDPSAGLDLVLNVDPFGKKFCDVYDKQNASQNSKSYSFGSFLVYRKLEQDVKSFNEKVKRIATCKLDDSTGSLEEREAIVRAFVVGRRKEDGCPVYVHDPNKSLFVDSNVSVNLNDFNYGADEEFQHDSAFKCPFNAHIRRMNPRGIQGKNQQSGYVYSGKSIYENSPEGQRNARIVRRGVSYGLPKDISYLSQETQDNLEAYKSLIENLINLGRELEIPIKGDKEGILFLCFQGSIDDQFDVLQKRYANTIDLGPFGGLNEQDPNRKSPVFGVDPLIGREDTDETNMSLTHSWWPKEWGNLNAGEIKFETLEETKFSDYVIPRGGEYFFTPSISFLKSLKEE